MALKSIKKVKKVSCLGLTILSIVFSLSIQIAKSIELTNASIQNEEKLSHVATHQYQELAEMGVFDAPSEIQRPKDNKKEGFRRRPLTFVNFKEAYRADCDNEKYELARNYRLLHVTTWCNDFLNNMPFIDDNEKKKYRIENSMHHLAGNAIHILKMIDPKYEEYRSKFKKYHVPSRKDVAEKWEEMNELFSCKESTYDLEKIISILKKFEYNKYDYEEIKSCEEKMSVYRNHRKYRADFRWNIKKHKET